MGCYILTRTDQRVSFMSEADTATYCVYFLTSFGRFFHISV